MILKQYYPIRSRKPRQNFFTFTEFLFDLPFTDIRMPGNAQLQLIRDMPNIAEGVPVILATACPSLSSAIQSVGLPVAAYLLKPLVPEKLLEYVHIAVEHFRAYRAVQTIRGRLQYWYEASGHIEEVLRDKSWSTLWTACPVRNPPKRGCFLLPRATFNGASRKKDGQAKKNKVLYKSCRYQKMEKTH